MPDTTAVATVTGVFLLAGLVKGVVGLGLPTVSLALLTATLGLSQAMTLLLVPSFVTNLWQAMSGGNATALSRRLWPFLGVAGVTVWLGAGAWLWVDAAMLSAVLGVLLVAYSALGLCGARLRIAAADERRAGVLAGALNGVLTGMTGSFVVPGVLYLQALGLPRDALIQAMGMLFTVSTLALAGALGGYGVLSRDMAALSALALIPALAGMAVGSRLRRRLSEQGFRRVFLQALALLGLYIVARSVTAAAPA